MNHYITLPEAAAMTARYRTNRELILTPAQQGKNTLPFSETFDRTSIDSLLAKPGCTAIRIYYGMDEALSVHAVMVGVNSANEDLITTTSSLATTETDETGDLLERGTRCPDICPPESELNT